MTTAATVDDPSRTTRRGLLARYPITSFFVLAFALAWIVEIPLDLAANGVLPALAVPAQVLLVAGATFAPVAAAFIMTAAVDGRAGVTLLLRRLIRWRVGVVWYLVILVGIPLAIVVGAVVVPGAIGSARPGLLGGLIAAYPLAFLMTFLLGGPLGEEPGWRGFALPRLQKAHGPLAGNVILGVLWALWHFPLFLSKVWTPPTIPNAIMFVVMITALTVIMGWVFNHARGSVLLTMLMHASFNTFANKVNAPLFPLPLFDDLGLLPVLIGFTGTAIVLIIVTRGRLGYDALKPADVEVGRAA